MDVSAISPPTGTYTEIPTSDRSRPDLEDHSADVSPPDDSAPAVIPDISEDPRPEENAAGEGAEIYGPEDGGEEIENNAPPQAPAGEEAEGEEELSPEERQRVRELQQIDREVRQHEQAHAAAAGPHLRGGPTYEFTEGPDGRRYATGGSVDLDTSREDTPEETIEKMRTVRQAALAPADPSPEDYQVAQKAARREAQARQEKAEENREEMTGEDSEQRITEETAVADNPDGSGEEAENIIEDSPVVNGQSEPEPTGQGGNLADLFNDNSPAPGQALNLVG